ncbi:DUF1361 domain-containing protein [Flagellimonas meridianipacifica]|uniref:Putative membrane protein n=1 Tax=Flagellimonas meridianipacifica TaxID=1080225 RepID=A0A2T0M8Q2_9FLAO|nr:DUF1361 domain-containing protein [Allomuricauda pacifica]PRX53860.1 putative membrane protein [Allomuricauda pacifica]
MKISLSPLKPYTHLILSVVFAFVLIVFRINVTHSGPFLFLVWNLFLAGIPYAITQALLYVKPMQSKIMFFLGFTSWLLFLPNSPYIITDFIHLQHKGSHLFWLDIIIIFAFALNGLLFGILSLFDMNKLLSEQLPKKVVDFILFAICILSGYGIYLGRFLRFNSWDLFLKPATLFSKMSISLGYTSTWLISITFGLFLWVSFSLFRRLGKP